MKHLKKAFLLLFSIVLVSGFQSCDKKTAQDLVNKYVNKMSATLNGSAFTASNTNAARNSFNGGYQLTIDGTSSSGQRITVAINNYTGATGTFNVNGTNAICAYNSGASGSSDVIASSGQVVITKIDNSTFTNGAIVDGTFSFTAGSNSVTSGTFSVFIPS